jgi:hypothetical protein
MNKVEGTISEYSVENNGEYAILKTSSTESAMRFFKELHSEIKIKQKILNFIKIQIVASVVIHILSATLLYLLLK